MRTFQHGDIVSLLSGSPMMTVEMTRTDGFIPVVWFEYGEKRRDCFEPKMLQRWVRAFND